MASLPHPSNKILLAISLQQEHCKSLLSWAIHSLAKPTDTIIAFHVLVGKDPRKKFPMKKKTRAQIRHAKAHLISVLAEFTNICHSKQVNLEAKVGFSSSIGRGLVDEAKSISAHFLLLSRPTNPDFRISHEITKYTTQFAPSDCSVVLVGRPKEPQNDSFSDASAISKVIEREKSSPLSVLSVVERDSINSSSDDASSFTGSTVSSNFLSSSSDKAKRQPTSLYRLISSLISNSPLRRWRGNDTTKNQKPQPLMRCFSYAEISRATNDFHEDNIVGVGGYSEVYRGDLSDGRRIAVKRLAKDNSDMNKEKEFLTELGIISHVSHPNTAILLGCCIERGLYLIFKFSENGNLYSALHDDDERVLDWPIRYKIAVGVARGLHYLHKRCNHRIIHRDIKASNVLLGPDYEPQITDFGLAKWLPNKWTHHAVIPVEGTFGYLAPEYFMHGIVDEKTDVYAFGILLLEILTGRKPVDSCQKHLLVWAKALMERGNTRELADPKLKGKYDEQQMHRLILTASHCVHQSPICRPSTTQVLELLTSGNEAAMFGKSWRSPKEKEKCDDYSMIFGYDIPLNPCFDSII